MPSSPAKAVASANWTRARLGESAINRQHVAAQGLMRRPCQKCRIDAARVCDQSPSQRAEELIQQVAFGGEIEGLEHAVILRWFGWRLRMLDAQEQAGIRAGNRLKQFFLPSQISEGTDIG